MADNAQWYVVHTYSGYENTVASAIVKAAENLHMQDYILEVKIPTETVVEKTDKGDKEVERKIFPGYVIVKMIMTDESWHLVRNVRGATGFVGTDGKAIPLTEKEALELGIEKKVYEAAFAVGDTVKIIDGPLDGFTGVVQEVDPEEGTVQLMVSMFGRETPVDLYVEQVEKTAED